MTLTNGQIIQHLGSLDLGVEVLDEFPSDIKNVRHGIYVDGPSVISRTGTALTFCGCGSVYNIVESVIVVYVSFQDDITNDAVNCVIQALAHTVFSSYNQCNYTVNIENLNRATYYSYNFELTRTDIT
jgi:hypothetical protein